MTSTEPINLDGQPIKLLIESCKKSSTLAKEQNDRYREMQYVILAATLTNKLKEFHAKAGQELSEKYCMS